MNYDDCRFRENYETVKCFEESFKTLKLNYIY